MQRPVPKRPGCLEVMSFAQFLAVCRRSQWTKHVRKRNRFMCYDSVAERRSFQSGHSKEGIRWDTSQNYIDMQ